jgi:hypothetical protein
MNDSWGTVFYTCILTTSAEGESTCFDSTVGSFSCDIVLDYHAIFLIVLESLIHSVACTSVAM